MQYIKVNDISEATHWIPTYDEEYKDFNLVTLLKPYKLFEYEYEVKVGNHTSIEYETCITDNNGYPIPAHSIHNGYFVRKVEDNLDEIFKKYNYNLGCSADQQTIGQLIDNIKLNNT